MKYERLVNDSFILSFFLPRSRKPFESIEEDIIVIIINIIIIMISNIIVVSINIIMIISIVIIIIPTSSLLNINGIDEVDSTLQDQHQEQKH